MKTFHSFSDRTLYTCSSKLLASGFCGPLGCCGSAHLAATSAYPSPHSVGL